MIKKFGRFNSFRNPPDILNLSPEIQLFFKLVQLSPGNSVLAIGSPPSNEILRACCEMNLNLTLCEPEQSKINLVTREFSNKIDCFKSSLNDLPFEDNSFEYSFFFNSLGNSENPQKALEEAFRVTKNSTFIGVTNRFAIKGMQETIKDFLLPHQQRLRLFSVWELKQIIRDLLGDVPVKWRSVSVFDFENNYFLKKVGYSDFIQKSPFGNFVGISVNLTPKFWLKPLTLKTKNSKKVTKIQPVHQRPACRNSTKN